MGFRGRITLYVSLLCLVAGSLAGQGLTGNLSGKVTQDGNPLPGATVTATSASLQGARSTVTNEAGGYTLGALPPGDYNVRFELSGLTPVNVRVQVAVATSARADADMKLSAVSEAITVTATSSTVAESTEVATNLQQTLIETLPMNRNIVAITNLAPGTLGGINGPQISGGMSFDNLYMVNGAVIQENLRGQPFNLFIEDAIQETTVQTAGVSAEFGNFTGGVVNAVTKSGGNEFSGSLRDSLSNPNWTARSANIFRSGTATECAPGPAGCPIEVSANDPIDDLNEVYEGTLGGRIIRDRLWFFAAGRSAKTNNPGFFSGSTISFSRPTKDERLELKLTGSITNRHNVVGSYINAPTEQTNNCQFSCADATGLDEFVGFPNNFQTLFYNGVLTNNLLLEAKYTAVNFKFDSLGGEATPPRTPVNILASSWGFANAPVFSGNTTTDIRNNKEFGLKTTYYLGTQSLGNHSLTLGGSRFHEERLANNHQSPTDYRIDVRSIAPTRDASGNVLVSMVNRGLDRIIWFPILLQSEGSDLNNDALYVNDKWDLNNHWSFNLGLRWDRNHSQNSEGAVVADDSKISPRLGASYDVFGNGRLRLNASYGDYVGRLAENVASGNTSGAGVPANFVYLYQGPDILNVSPATLADRVMEWFEANGGTGRQLAGAFIPGFSSRLGPETLVSPNVSEYTFGGSTQIGRGFVRADFIRREWKDFYVGDINTDIGTVTNELGQTFDLLLIRNGNEHTREYTAVELQGQYRISSRLNFGGNYTWSLTEGNITGEDTGSGPFATISANYYPEYYDFSWFLPVGPLTTDQTHKLRAWLTYDQPTIIGNFNFSVLQRFDSGSPYSLTGNIDIRQNANFYGPGQPGGVANPGYQTPPTSIAYFFSDRGEFRFDDLTATDFALNYSTNPGWLMGVSLFAQAEVINVFNEQNMTVHNTSVFTASNDATLQRFNPRAGDVPVEGVHWRKGPLFGLPTSASSNTTAGHFQTPRTYRVSLGLRF
jgi:outer membrane receptor protein involved in Fe transport